VLSDSAQARSFKKNEIILLTRRYAAGVRSRVCFRGINAIETMRIAENPDIYLRPTCHIGHKRKQAALISAACSVFCVISITQVPQVRPYD
jgi:hypothetical protein